MLLLLAGGRKYHNKQTKAEHTDEGNCKWCEYQGQGKDICHTCSRSCVWNYRKYKPDNLVDNFKLERC